MATKLKKLTEADFLAARDRLFELKRLQDEARDEEIRIRTFLADRLHDGDEGSKTVEVHGHKVTVTRVLYRRITEADAERFTKEHGDLSLECLKWRPEVKVSGYKKNFEVMDEYITTTDGPPQVAFKS